MYEEIYLVFIRSIFIFVDILTVCYTFIHFLNIKYEYNITLNVAYVYILLDFPITYRNANQNAHVYIKQLTL